MAAKKQPEYIKARPDGGVDIKLSRPLNVSGTQMPVITMREPLVEDQLAADEAGEKAAQQETAMIGNLTMLAPADLKKLPLKDYRRLQEAFLGFLD